MCISVITVIKQIKAADKPTNQQTNKHSEIKQQAFQSFWL